MKNKVCKIISTAFVPRVIRMNTQTIGSPLGLFSHAQNFPTPDSVIELLKFSLEVENQTDPGCGVDIIIVNNDVGYEKGNAFLNAIDGKCINSGVIKILHRENYGRSFGGYNDAFKVCRDQYEYFIFTEDDVLINGSGYAQKGINRISSNPKIGFLAYIGLNLEGFGGGHRGEMIHAHGGVGMAPKTSLNHIFEKFGFLPHVHKNQAQNYQNIVLNGEIAFTNIYATNGFLIADAEDKLYEFAYDKIRNINIPRYIDTGMLKPSFR